MLKLARWGAMATMVTLAGCGSVATADPIGAAEAELSAEPGGAHGPMAAIREALQKLDLKPDQKAGVEKLATDAKARHLPVFAAREALAKAIADQVQAGAIDRGALAAPMGALLTAIDQARPGDRAAFVRLHEILDKTQRGKLVDSLEARFAEHGGKRWGGGHGPGMGALKQWANELHLSDAQREQVKTAMMSHFGAHKDAMRAAGSEMRAEGKQILERFRQDTFTLDDSPALFGRPRLEAHIGKLLFAVEVVVPILTPAQRTQAAAKIRALPRPAW
jgi:Spy/CpxP family protein refolding chaperone